MGDTSASSSDQLSLTRQGNEGNIGIPRAPNGPNEANRLRIVQACVACRERKAKCDGNRPKCATCKRLNRVCAYTGSKRDKQRLQLQSLQRKAHIYEELLGEIIPQVAVHENISIENVFKVCHQI